MTSSSITQPTDLERVRASYDRVADAYVELVSTTELGDIRRQPWLKAVIDVFADAVRDLGPVLDVGCGPGTVTGYLHERGLDVSGIDLSPRKVEHARRLYPQCRFCVGSSTALDLAPRSLSGILGWWSLFNLPRDVLPQVLASFQRALVPGGQVVVATHVGDEDVERTEAYGGVPVQWTTHRWRPEQLVTMLDGAGLRTVAELRLPAQGEIGPGVALVAQRDD